MYTSYPISMLFVLGIPKKQRKIPKNNILLQLHKKKSDIKFNIDYILNALLDYQYLIVNSYFFSGFFFYFATGSLD